MKQNSQFLVSSEIQPLIVMQLVILLLLLLPTPFCVNHIFGLVFVVRVYLFGNS